MLIGISGTRGSGKTVQCDYINRAYKSVKEIDTNTLYMSMNLSSIYNEKKGYKRCIISPNPCSVYGKGLYETSLDTYSNLLYTYFVKLKQVVAENEYKVIIVDDFIEIVDLIINELKRTENKTINNWSDLKAEIRIISNFLYDCSKNKDIVFILPIPLHIVTEISCCSECGYTKSENKVVFQPILRNFISNIDVIFEIVEYDKIILKNTLVWNLQDYIGDEIISYSALFREIFS